MSTALEIVEAQRQVWQLFVARKIPLKLWPRHFATASQLQHIMEHGIPAHEKILLKPCASKK